MLKESCMLEETHKLDESCMLEERHMLNESVHVHMQCRQLNCDLTYI